MQSSLRQEMDKNVDAVFRKYPGYAKRFSIKYTVKMKFSKELRNS